VCFKMKNVRLVGSEYVVPTVLARPLVQRYGSKRMAKLPDELKRARVVDYKTGRPTDRLPVFERHPVEERPEEEVGYVTKVKYDPRYGLVGELHVNRDKISSNMRRFFDKREAVGGSIGFRFTPGPPGEFDGVRYDVVQKNIHITHYAILPPNESMGRCPLTLCGVGIV